MKPKEQYEKEGYIYHKKLPVWLDDPRYEPDLSLSFKELVFICLGVLIAVTLVLILSI